MTQLPSSPLQFHYEALFRSVHYAVMDHACREFLFIVDFFKMPVGGAMEIFKEVMGRTLDYLQVLTACNLHMYCSNVVVLSLWVSCP